MSAESSASEAGQSQLRTVSGQVVSDKMDKTISVSISRVVKHPVYGKYIRRTTKVMAHDEENSCKAGDVVSISECKPRSKRKAWQVVEILERAEAQ
jgi:small subunit ribosomal protein S17